MSEQAQPQSRSTFITVLAWVFILGSGFTFMISVLQSIIVTLFFDDPAFQLSAEGHPALINFMVQNIRWIIYSFMLLGLFTFVASIALLKRKNWARKAFVLILGLSIVWQLAGVVMQFMVMGEVNTLAGESAPEGFGVIQQVIRYFSLTFALAMAALFVWLIKKLISPAIVAEFKAPA